MREKFKRFCDTANPDLLRLVIIFVLVGLLLAGFLLFGRSGDGDSVHACMGSRPNMLSHPTNALPPRRKKTRTPWRGSRFPAQTLTRLCSSTATMTIICAVTRMGPRITARLHRPPDYACRMDSSVKVSRNLIFYGHTFTDEDYTGGFEDLHKYRVFEFGAGKPVHLCFAGR